MSYLVTGNTFPVRAQMRALGGSWDRNAKGWRFADAATATRAAALIAPPAVSAVPDAPTAAAAPSPAAAPIVADDVSRALRSIVAVLTPRGLADALERAGKPRAEAEAIAVTAAEVARALADASSV